LEKTRANILCNMLRPVQIPENWTLSISLALTEFHGDVDWFVSDYIATLSSPSQKEAKQECEPLRRRKMDRVRSAFFRFEMYRRVLSKRYLYEERPDPDERKEMLPEIFAAGENEQLATAYEYLLHRLSIGLSQFFLNTINLPMFSASDDVAEHDILWGKHEIRYNKDEEPPFKNTFKEHCLSLGLAWLRKLVAADTYDEYYQLLAPETGEQHTDFIFNAL